MKITFSHKLNLILIAILALILSMLGWIAHDFLKPGGIRVGAIATTRFPLDAKIDLRGLSMKVDMTPMLNPRLPGDSKTLKEPVIALKDGTRVRISRVRFGDDGEDLRGIEVLDGPYAGYSGETMPAFLVPEKPEGLWTNLLRPQGDEILSAMRERLRKAEQRRREEEYARLRAEERARAAKPPIHPGEMAPAPAPEYMAPMPTSETAVVREVRLKAEAELKVKQLEVERLRLETEKAKHLADKVRQEAETSRLAREAEERARREKAETEETERLAAANRAREEAERRRQAEGADRARRADEARREEERILQPIKPIFVAHKEATKPSPAVSLAKRERDAVKLNRLDMIQADDPMGRSSIMGIKSERRADWTSFVSRCIAQLARNTGPTTSTNNDIVYIPNKTKCIVLDKEIIDNINTCVVLVCDGASRGMISRILLVDVVPIDGPSFSGDAPDVALVSGLPQTGRLIRTNVPRTFRLSGCIMGKDTVRQTGKEHFIDSGSPVRVIASNDQIYVIQVYDNLNRVNALVWVPKTMVDL